MIQYSSRDFSSRSSVLVRRATVDWLIHLPLKHPQVRSLLFDCLADRDIIIFEQGLMALFPMVRTDAQVFVRWSCALVEFIEHNQETLIPPNPQILLFVLANHRAPEVALALLRNERPELAQVLADALPTARTGLKNLLGNVEQISQIIEKLPGPPFTHFLLGLGVGMLARRKRRNRRPLNRILSRYVRSPNPRLQMAALGMQLGLQELSSRRALLLSAADSSVAPLLQAMGGIAAATAARPSNESLAELRTRLSHGNFLTRVLALEALLLQEEAVTADGRLAADLIGWLGSVTEGVLDMRSQLPGRRAIHGNGWQWRIGLARVIAHQLSTNSTLYEQVVAMLASPRWQERQGAGWALALMSGGPPADVRARLHALATDTRMDLDLLERLTIARALLALGGCSDTRIQEMWTLVEQTFQYGLRPWEFIPYQGKVVREAAVRLVAELPHCETQRLLLDKATRDENVEIRDLAYRLFSALPKLTKGEET